MATRWSEVPSGTVKFPIARNTIILLARESAAIGGTGQNDT
jgi:hypothetical protein